MIHVLFVDDDPLTREAMYRTLRWQRPDWSVDMAEDSGSALALLESASIDAAILDLRLPGPSGLEIARQARERNPDLICFMLTAHGNLETAIASINEVGVAGYFQKPCPMSKLIQSVEAAISAQQLRRDRMGIAAAALEAGHAGAILVDSNLFIRQQNRKAEAMMRKTRHLMADSSGVLRGATPAQTRKLQAAVQRATGSRRTAAVSLMSDESAAALTAVVRPLEHGGQAVIFVCDPKGEDALEPGVLQTLFDLTPAEARLAGELANGHTVEEAAVRLNISVSSARTYLKTVFSKMDVNRQVDLVRLILGSAAVFAGDDV